MINQAHLHLMLNHIPVLGTVFAFLLLGWALLKGSRDLLTAGLAMMLIVGIFTIPVFSSGEAAEDAVEAQSHVSAQAMEEHEEMAESARWAGLAGGVLAIAGLLAVRGRERYPAWVGISAVIVAIIAATMFGLTASHGGKISHPEIRGDGLLPVSSGAAPSMQGERRGHDDDDDDD